MIALPEINFQRTPATLILAAVAVALEAVSLVNPELRLSYYNNYLGILPRIWAGELWRPFTSTLMHGGLLHAGFNVYWLILFGTALEGRIGPYRMLGLYVLLGYVSMMPEYVIGSYWREQPVMIVGLSGVVYGLFGILLIGRRWRPEFNAVCDQQTVQILVGWFFLSIVLTHLGVLNVANIAHAGGFGFGMLYGLAAFDRRRRWQWSALAIAASLLVLATLVACPGHRGYEHVKRGGRIWWGGSAAAAVAFPVVAVGWRCPHNNRL